MITKCGYCGSVLPCTNIDSIFYNNYIPKGCDSVRSASAHNISLVGDVAISVWQGLIDEVTKMNLEDVKWNLSPGDMIILNLVGKDVLEGKYKSLYIPTALVGKPSDGNMSNIK